MACRITKVNDKITEVLASNGQHSNLFETINRSYPDEQAIDLYAQIYLPEFKEKLPNALRDNNDEPVTTTRRNELVFTDGQTHIPLEVDDKPGILSNVSYKATSPIYNISYAVSYNAESIFAKGVKKDDETGKYIKEDVQYNSITGDVIKSIQMNPFVSEDTPGMVIAKGIWKDTDPNEKKVTNLALGSPITMQQYADLRDQSFALGIAKGDIFHKTISNYITGTNDGKLATLYQESGILPSEFSWLDGEAIRTILHRTGTDYVTMDMIAGEKIFSINPAATDKLHSERPLLSPLLGWGGTPDLWIDHGNDVYSVFDLKTGDAFNRSNETFFFKHGRTSPTDIFDTPRNRAKLQLMLYAFMAKVENPNAKFRNLELLHITNRWNLSEGDAYRHVNVTAMLEIIEGSLKETYPEQYKAIKALPHFEQLFNPESYMTTDSSSFESTHPNADPSMVLRLKILELQSLVLYDKDIVGGVLKDDSASKARYAKIAKLMGGDEGKNNGIIHLRGDKSISYAAWDTDMGWMDRWLGSASSSTNPYVQLYYSMLTSQKQKAREMYDPWRKKFDELIKALISEKNLKSVSNLIGGVDRTKLWAFAYKNVGTPDSAKYRLKVDTDPEWRDGSLTDLEKRVLTFINDSVENFFVDEKSDFKDPISGKKVALANRTATYRRQGNKDVPVTNLDLFNRAFARTSQQAKTPFKFERGFLPKHPQQLNDVLNTVNDKFAKAAKFIWNKNMTNYFERVFDGWYNSDEAIPMKYLGGGDIDSTLNYTMNLELSIDSFVKQHYYKQYLDEVYAFGKGMQIYIGSKENANQGITFDRMKQYFEDSINLHVLGKREKELQISGRSFGVIRKNGYEQFNFAKFLRSLRNYFVGPTMWLKPLTGLPNFVFASLVTMKEGLKNSLGLGGANANFTLKDVAAGFAEGFKMVLWDGTTGAYRKNKAFILMEKFGFMPDSHDWYTQPNHLLTARNKLFTGKSMMAFHTLPEEVISTALFVAQLRAMKITLADGTKSNMWDAYDVELETLSDGTQVAEAVWKGGVRGQRNVSNTADKPEYVDVTEPTVEEINAIKYLYEKIHGGYRTDERVAAEYYVAGELMLQLKKYLPAILKNVWASKGIRNTQGSFKTEMVDGKEVLKWTPQVIEGRYRILLGMLFNSLSMKTGTNGEKGNKFLEYLGIQSDDSYKYENLKEAQKEDVNDFILTSMMWIALLVGYYNIWDRDDKDTFKKLYGRITNDFAGNVSPLEIIKNLTSLYKPIALDKSYKMASSGTDLLWSVILYESGYTDQALTKEGHFRGASEFERNIHFISAWHDLIKAIRESDDFAYALQDKYK